MKQTSDSAVRPRRELLAALGVSAVALCTAPDLLAASETAKKRASSTTASIDRYAFTILIGRLCVDKGFRDQFLKSKDADAALALLKKEHMPTSSIEKDWVAAIFKDTKQLPKLEEACKVVEQAATVPKMEKMVLPPPCNPWPC